MAKLALIPVLLALLFASPAEAAAAPAADTMSAPARGAEKPGMWRAYKPEKDRKTVRAEGVPSGTLVVISYVIIWLVVLLYVVLLALRQRRLTGEVQELRHRLAELERSDGGGPPSDA